MAERVETAPGRGSRAKKGVVAVPPGKTSSPPKPSTNKASTRAAPAKAASEQRRRRRGLALDDADLQIMEILALDGRVTNRAIATKVGLKEVTVASRIRVLNER